MTQRGTRDGVRHLIRPNPRSGHGGATNATICPLTRDSGVTRRWHCCYRRRSERPPLGLPMSKIVSRTLRQCAVQNKAKTMGCLNIRSPRSAYAMTDRLLVWHDQAKLAGRETRAETLLALAWYSYDRPADTMRRFTSRPMRFCSEPLMISRDFGGISAAYGVG
jgi:hypothetical protein